MTTDDRENIDRKLKHVLALSNDIVNIYRHITCTERAALLLALAAAVQQLAANLRNLAGRLRKHLLDTFRIDYIQYARSFEECLKIWQEELQGAPMVHNLDTLSGPITDPNDIVLKENTDYKFFPQSLFDDDYDPFEMRVGLISNASLLSSAIEAGLEDISITLRKIENDNLALRTNRQAQNERLKELEKQYKEVMWDEDKKRFIEEVEDYTKDNGKTKDVYNRFLNKLIRDATDPHDRKILSDLNECYLNNQSTATYVVYNRDKLTLNDLARHFCFVNCHHLLSLHISCFDRESPSKEYPSLFANLVADQFAHTLAFTITKYVNFNHNYQYAALQMAMEDLGLIRGGNRNGKEMMQFLNNVFSTDIKDQTTLTQWTGKLLGNRFGEMDEQHLTGNYTNDDFLKLKDIYWLCLSIINKVLGLDLREKHFAEYLYTEHEKTPTINNYIDIQGQSIMDRLFELKSVIQGLRVFN